jgi:hypothetical protein
MKNPSLRKEKQMITRNESPDNPDDSGNDTNASRDFTRIRRAAKPFWEEFLPKSEDQVARGILWVPDGMAPTADLSYDKDRKRIQLMIRLHVKDGFSSSQVRSVRRAQDRTSGLCSIALDEDGHIVRIRSQSVLPAAVMAQAVVPHVVEDAVTLLEDENLRDIVNSSVSY